MKRVLILYKSKYGAAKKYAGMIKEALGGDVFDVKDFEKADLVQYDAVVFAGAIYASGISGLKVLRSKWPLLKQKRVAVFCVGASPYDEKAIREVKQNNLKDELKDIPMFYGRGAWDESAMTFKDKTLCKLLQKMISGKSEAECEPWMKALLSASGKKCDWTDPKYLEPLIAYMNR